MNPQAEELNVIINKHNPVLFNLFSEKGKAIYFPKRGILGQAAEARGKKINATIGEAIEDDGLHMRLKSIEEKLNISPSLAFPYAPSFGRPDIRERWKKMIYEKNPSLTGTEISLPVVTNALTHGLSVCGYLFLNAGEKIIVSDHFWDNYELVFTNAFGSPIDTFTLFKNNGFNVAALEAKLNEGPKGKKVLLLNFPNNPSGYTPTVEEMNAIADVIKKSAENGNQIVVIIDDAYFGLVFEKGIAKESIFTLLANMHENVLAVKLDGPTKEDYVWGFRVGFVTYGIKGGNADLYSALESKTAGAVRGNISNASNLSQSLLLQAFDSPTYWTEKEEKYKTLQSRYEKTKAVLQNKKYEEVFSALPFNSGYFMCIELKHGLNAEAVRKHLLQKYETGVIVIGKVIRVAFSSVSKEKIVLLFENLYNACNDLLNEKK